MPEGPEVRRICDQLKRWEGWNIAVSGFNGRYEKERPQGYASFENESHNVTVEKVDAKGKFLYWSLSNDWSIWVTLGMSGTWEKHPKKHEVMSLRLSRMVGDTHFDGWISFVDARHFGTVKFVKDRQLLNTKLDSMRWDFLEREHSTTAIWWFLKDTRSNLHDKQISVVLMDQSIFPGVGNYLRCEILYASGVSPWRKLKDVTYEELDLICKNAHQIMRRSYESGGATIATYRDTEGNKGEFSSKFAVYGRKQDPLGNAVIKDKTSDGRTIHWVKEVQV